MRHPSDVALGHLRRLLSRDPMLRDVLADALPGLQGDPGFTPEVDVFETASAHVVVVELAGVPRAGVRVALEGSHLVVEGQKPAWAPEGGRATSTERRHGPFRRVFLLPADVDADAVRATMDDGVLRVEVPRTHRGARRDVPVEPS